MNNIFSPDMCHISRYGKGELRYKDVKDFQNWKENLKSKYIEVLGIMPEKVSLNIQKEKVEKKEGYTDIRLTFNSEKSVKVPCHLLMPDNISKPPVIICLQGHSTGMHLSLGIEKYSGDKEAIEVEGRDFALQAVKQGYAAFAIEQRAFGERKSHIAPVHGCIFPAMSALILGRTLIGERVFDVMRAIDVLEELCLTDNQKIACTGDSGGGVITYYTACLDERIKVAMPCCNVCTYLGSIGKMAHCVCNYLPSAAKYFDVGDLAGLIVPRHLIVIAGKHDPIFPIDEVNKSFNTIKKIYTDTGYNDNCVLIVGNGDHQFYPKETWSMFNETVKKLGWRK